MKKNALLLITMFIISILLVAGCGDKGTTDYNRGILAMKKGDYEKACIDFTTAIKANKKQPEYFISYGMTLLQLSRFGEAASSFDKGLLLSEDNIDNVKRCYRGLGISRYYLKENEKAREYLSKALEINTLPDLNLECHLYLGAIDEASEDLQNAYESYKNVLAIDATKIPAIVGKYKVELALGHEKEAKKTLMEGLKCTPVTVEEKFLYAKLLFYNKSSNAEEELLKMVDLYEESYILLGEIQMTKNKYDEAIQYFEKYVEISGDTHNLIIYNLLATCYISKYDYEKALEWCDNGVKIQTSDEELQTIRYNQVIVYEKLHKYKKAYLLAKEYAVIYPEDKRFSSEEEYLKAMVD